MDTHEEDQDVPEQGLDRIAELLENKLIDRLEDDPDLKTLETAIRYLDKQGYISSARGKSKVAVLAERVKAKAKGPLPFPEAERASTA
jgi:hypothetical protein